MLRNRSLALNSPPPSNKPFLGWLSDGADRAQTWKWLLYQELKRMKEIGRLRLGELRKAKRERKIISFAGDSCGQHSLVAEHWLWDQQPVSCAWLACQSEWTPPTLWASTGKCSGTGYHHVLLIKDEQITPLKAQGFYLLQYLTLVRVLTGVKHQGEDLRLFLHGF